MDPVQPVKRSKELTPLSHDHHRGLLAAWNIKQGIKNGTETAIVSEYVQWLWKNELQNHFKQEEQYLMPALPHDNELILQMLDEHQEIEALIHINEAIPDPEILIRFSDMLHDHIRFEERVLFPFIEQNITPALLDTIGQQLSGPPKECPLWENEFWKKK